MYEVSDWLNGTAANLDCGFKPLLMYRDNDWISVRTCDVSVNDGAGPGTPSAQGFVRENARACCLIALDMLLEKASIHCNDDRDGIMDAASSAWSRCSAASIDRFATGAWNLQSVCVVAQGQHNRNLW